MLTWVSKTQHKQMQTKWNSSETALTSSFLLFFLCCSAIQFGYVCFFSAAFPFAPLCALLNNLIVCRVGAYKLCRLTRRPLARKASGVGIWLRVLQLMSVIAVLSNCALIAITSLQLSAWLPAMPTSTKILLLFAFEHAILAIKLVISIAIPDVTVEVARHRKKEKVREHTRRLVHCST